MNDATPRKIIHVDMDAFYASVEQRDDPALKDRPVAVGGGHRGVVAAASYEARVFGVRSAMPSVTARRRCPDLIFVKPRFDVYKAVSQQIRAIFADYTDLIEPLSLDEAYLDVSEDRHALGSARAIAEQIRARIRAETGLTASAGVSYCKFVAKLASDHNKPDGICVIPPGKGAGFVATLPVKRFHGVGPVTAAKMERLGIMTGADLAAWPIEQLEAHFGSAGRWYWRIARGIDEREVRSDRSHKSVTAERTFDVDGNADVSPRGGPSGFIKVLSPAHLAIADLGGNNRLDTLMNVVATGKVALLMITPGQTETIRINGTGHVSTNPELLASFELPKVPKSAIVLQLDTTYMHCAKAFMRSGMWDTDVWAEMADVPDGSAVLASQGVVEDEAATRVALDEGYKSALAHEAGE